MNFEYILEANESWQVPEFDVALWSGRQKSYCVIIPVINEGERIKKLLAKMVALNIAALADIIIVDGGSTDGSLELKALKEKNVCGLLVKTGAGKLSAQLRCAYAFVLEQGYEGVVTIDGNDKDDPEAIPRFIEALQQGIDFVQASRFIAGGRAKHTPVIRDLAIRFIHAPLLTLSSGFHWTDTTQGFRAYSRKLLLDPQLAIFRNIFEEYELLAYLSHRAPHLGYRCIELPTRRVYPKGEIPTKISAISGNLKVFKTLLLACCGGYNAAGSERLILPSITQIVFLCLLGFLFSILAFFPGWMSPDSVAIYTQAKTGFYTDWHPILMAWWWGKLNKLYVGPALVLIQNLLLYWGSWYLFAKASRFQFGKVAYVLPLLGFWPGLLFPLGEIWKDICFATSIFFAWGILIAIKFENRLPYWRERIILLALLVWAFGVKTNGLTVLPFVLFFWGYLEAKKQTPYKILRVGVFTFVMTTVIVGIASFIVPSKQIIGTHPFQYTQTYDLLAISVKSGQVVLPSYITKRAGNTSDTLKKFYFVGGNDLLFYNSIGNLTTTDKEELTDLNRLWKKSIMDYPRIYLRHRLDNFKALLRWEEKTTATVAAPIIVENSEGFVFHTNKFSNWLVAQLDRHPWMFFPWIYCMILLVSMCILIYLKWQRVFVSCFSGSAIFFIWPHFFIAPAADYRYLYYSCFCAAILFYFAIVVFLQRIINKLSNNEE